MNNPKHPIYIVSKGRWDSRVTSRALDIMNVPHKLVVESDEYADYAEAVGPERVLVLPEKYKDDYDTFWEREPDNKVGPGAARNFVWDHSTEQGHSHHWVMDDNLEAFYRLNRNVKYESRTGAIFRAMEDFVERYSNVAISGPNYEAFCKAVDPVPPLITNTRIYSCLLIRNDIPYRWRGRYNEDTDICLRALKDGWCTVQFNAFLQGKVTTQRMKGGNTEEFYSGEGTVPKSKMLEEMHPDVAKMVHKFNRWHHHVDYTPFKATKLTRKEGVVVPSGVNEYGMKLVIEKGSKKCR